MRNILHRGAGLFVVLAMLASAAPVRAEVHGGIEIGAKGIKATVIDVTKGTEGPEVAILWASTHNSTLTADLGTTRRFDDKAVADAVEALAGFVAKMTKESKVPVERIHIVASSGLFVPLGDKAEDIRANQDLLRKAVEKATERKLEFIDVERESILSIDGIIPASRRDTSILCDIGSGNTKGGCIASGKYTTFGIPYGSVTLADAARKQGGSNEYAKALAKVSEETVTPALKKSTQDKDILLKRERVYLSGGAAWALATLIRPEDRSGFVALTRADIKAYRELLAKTPGEFPKIDVSGIKDAGVKKAAEAEIEKVRAAFKPDQLLAGAELLQALATAFDFGEAKKVYFARHATVGWILAYVQQAAMKDPN